MGLDMYLSKNTYVQNWDFMGPDELHKITVRKGGKIRKDIKPERISNIVEKVAYWRKANCIHRWFVEHVQGGKDDCGTYDVSTEQLQELLAICKRVLNTLELVDGQVKNGYRFEGGVMTPIMEQGKTVAQKQIAAAALPTTEGFFFGSTDYDEGYIHDLQETVRQLEPLLKEKSDSSHFEYRASW